MLSGEYNILIDNMRLTDIIAFILLILPFIFLFLKEKWIYGLYVVSIVANLPLIFMMKYKFSYEIIIVVVLILKTIAGVYRAKTLKYSTTKENLNMILFLFAIIFFNILISFFNFNKTEFITRFIIYLVNVFILIAFTHYLSAEKKLFEIRNAVLTGAFLLVLSMIAEMLYGYYGLGIGRLRPAGLLLDPNVAAFALNICLIFSFYQKERSSLFAILINVFIKLFIIFGVFITVSRSGYIGTTFILVYQLIFYSKRQKFWIPALTALVFAVCFFCFYNMIIKSWDILYNMLDLRRIFPPGTVGTPGMQLPASGPAVPLRNERLTLLIAAVKVFFHNILFGVGIGNVAANIYVYSGVNLESHNMFLQLLVESGVIMGILLVVFVLFAFKFTLKTKGKERWFVILIFLTIIIEAMFNHNLLNLNIIWFVLAFMLSVHTLCSKNSKSFILRLF